MLFSESQTRRALCPGGFHKACLQNLHKSLAVLPVFQWRQRDGRDCSDAHLAACVEIDTRNGLLASVIPAAALIGNFHRPATLAHQAAKKYGGGLRLRGGFPALFFASSAAGDAALAYVEAAAAPQHRHPANHHPSGGRA